MGDGGFWLNRMGTMAQASNPGSRVPNYGLTTDLALSPGLETDDFDKLAQAITNVMASINQVTSITAGAIPTGLTGEARKPSLWDRATGLAGDAGNAVAGVLGEVNNVDNLLTPWDRSPGVGGKEDKLNWDFQDSADLTKEKLGGTAAKAATTPGLEQIFWGLEKINEYASTAVVATTLSEDDFGKLFQSGTWGDAHALQKDYKLNFGEAVAQTFYDKEVLLDKDRFEQIRQHNTAFNVAALAANVIAAWKADPNVLIGKGIGGARGLAEGRLAAGGRTLEVQRDILGASSMEAATAKAAGYTGLADKLRASYSLSLFDRAQNLRAKAQEMGFEEFSQLPAFQNSASGTVMAKLFQDVAGNDDDWNLVFRTSIGDPDALGELRTKRVDLNDKISAIELKEMPSLQSELEAIEAKYQARLAEQGKPADAAISIVSAHDYFLETESGILRSKMDELNMKLSTYQSHEDWMARMLPGLDETTDAVSSTSPNSIFGQLTNVGTHPTLASIKGKFSSWQQDPYSPNVNLFSIPNKVALRRVGAVSLNDVGEGAQAITAYMDQLAHVTGTRYQTSRDNVLGAFAGARTDTERKAAVEQLEREAITAVGLKHNLSEELMSDLGDMIRERRGKTWSKLTDSTIYSPIKGQDIMELRNPDGSVDKVRVPMDPTQLANFHSLTNLTDLDRMIRQNLDLLRDLDADRVNAVQAGASKARRIVGEKYNEFGEAFNSIWKPMALLSLRWPARVVADETLRTVMAAGALPVVANAARGGLNLIHNVGLVRPIEFWNGRKIKLGSLSEESLRAPRTNGFDAYDYRAITNPTGATPSSLVDMDKVDTARYDRLNTVTAKRKSQLRIHKQAGDTIMSPRLRDAVSTFLDADKPAWMRQWDERLAEAETSDTRGFYFDPVSGSRKNTGFGVSAYPGRLRTFEGKPTARELNYWIEKNSDLLAVKNNRVAVWKDKDTGRWHMDVVKTTKRREDAMLLASQVEATEFYDIADGFTRYLSEDFYGHFQSPWVKPVAENPPGGVAFDQQMLDDEAGAAIAGGFNVGPSRNAIGFGKKKWRTRDGKQVTYSDVFGESADDPNLYYSLSSSRDAVQALYAGHTRGLGKLRASRAGADYRRLDPAEAKPEEWAAAYSYFVNRHMRYSELAQKMLQGQSDDEVYEWLMGSAKGRELRKRLPERGQNAHRWVSEIRELVDHMFPNDVVRQAARDGEITPEQALSLVPPTDRMGVYGDMIQLGLGTSREQKLFRRVVDSTMDYLATKPTDALVRHPFASTVYNREMRNYISSVPAEKLTQDVLNAAEASARAKAIREIRRTLYNIADEREGVYLLRFVSPFFQAQLEVLERYARLSMEKPETLARMAQLLVGSQQIATGLWQVVDSEGNPAEGYSPDNQVIIQVQPWMKNIPVIGKALNQAGTLAVPVKSINIITGGGNPFIPSLGPIITIPLTEAYYEDRPELTDSAIYRWMFPYEMPRGSNWAERTANALLPAYARRLWASESDTFDDPAYVRRIGEINAQMLYRWETGGQEGPRPTYQDAVDAAKNEYRLRAASSFFFPVPVTPRSPYQFYIDEYRQYREHYGDHADEKFYDTYGPEFYVFAQRSTTSQGGMEPTSEAKRGFDQYKGLIERAPDLTSVLLGPFQGGDFNGAVYNWQLQNNLPGTAEKIRTPLSGQERIDQAMVGRGWVEYSKLASVIDAEIRSRVAQGGSPYLSASSNQDLAAWRADQIRTIESRNPGWQDAYNSRSTEMESWLRQAYSVAFDPSLDGREDIQTLRAYLIGRARLQDTLREREDSGQSSSDQLSFDPLGNPVGDNADLAYGWKSWIDEAKAKNPLFAEIYNRYLENDDLSTYIDPEVSSAVR